MYKWYYILQGLGLEQCYKMWSIRSHMQWCLQVASDR
jgi:hypothetical protein